MSNNYDFNNFLEFPDLFNFFPPEDGHPGTPTGYRPNKDTFGTFSTSLSGPNVLGDMTGNTHSGGSPSFQALLLDPYYYPTGPQDPNFTLTGLEYAPFETNYTSSPAETSPVSSGSSSSSTTMDGSWAQGTALGESVPPSASSSNARSYSLSDWREAESFHARPARRALGYTAQKNRTEDFSEDAAWLPPQEMRISGRQARRLASAPYPNAQYAGFAPRSCPPSQAYTSHQQNMSLGSCRNLQAIAISNNRQDPNQGSSDAVRPGGNAAAHSIAANKNTTTTTPGHMAPHNSTPVATNERPDTGTSQTPSNANKQNRQVYICDECSAEISTQRDLARHKETHEARKGWMCPGLDFPWALYGWERCTCPPDGYSRSDVLNRHLKSRGPGNPCFRLAFRLGWRPAKQTNVKVLQRPK